MSNRQHQQDELSYLWLLAESMKLPHPHFIETLVAVFLCGSGAGLSAFIFRYDKERDGLRDSIKLLSVFSLSGIWAVCAYMLMAHFYGVESLLLNVPVAILMGMGFNTLLGLLLAKTTGSTILTAVIDALASQWNNRNKQ